MATGGGDCRMKMRTFAIINWAIGTVMRTFAVKNLAE